MAGQPFNNKWFVRSAGSLLRLAIVLAFWWILLPGAQAGESSAAMELLFNTVDGKKLRLADLRGQVVVVNFWATWCPPCLEEIPELNQFHEQNAGKGAMVVGVTYMDPSTPEQLRSFLAKEEVRYPVIYGDSVKLNQLAKELGGVFGLPVSKLLDRQGKVVATKMGGVTAAALQDWVASYLGKVAASK
ncbi:TlpA family protein disulfide reductase [Candidatus Magnetaquicoccus inordinatus]|uniref:TlpA family protein disulfide reductase n=1 Tax=Candidatus Magnetaquicoccus inordinatus TaxID=2496818 RepID=UPI00102BC6CA|nr:TlpA disulfide reductase family protein [Candidatus Magnetaquicoccus inordinatus]